MRMWFWMAAFVLALYPDWAAAQSAAAGSLEPVVAAEPLEDAAADADGDWRLSGFGTLGISHTRSDRGLRFGREPAQPRAPGAIDLGGDSRLGIQVNGTLSPGWEVVSQLVVKRMHEVDPLSNRLELAYVGWTPDDHWRVRVGRYTPDLFLLAEYPNVGFAYPWVRPDMEVYGWLPMSSLDGADMRYQWFSDDDALWRLRASVGSWRGVASSLANLTRLKTRLSTLSLTRESGPLALRVSYTQAQNTISAGPAFDALGILQEPLGAVAALPVSPQVQQEAQQLLQDLPMNRNPMRYMGLGLLYEGAPWLIHAEYTRTSGGPTGVATDRGYVSLGWRAGALTWFGKVAASYAKDAPARIDATRWQGELTPIVGPQMAEGLTTAGMAGVWALNWRRFGQRVLTLGVRWDLDSQTALKLQMDHYRTQPNTYSNWDQLITDRPARAIQWSISMDRVF